jgi:hypothetical protein
MDISVFFRDEMKGADISSLNSPISWNRVALPGFPFYFTSWLVSSFAFAGILFSGPAI